MKVSSIHVNYLESIQIYLPNSFVLLFLFLFATPLAGGLAIVLSQG